MNIRYKAYDNIFSDYLERGETESESDFDDDDEDEDY